MSGKPYVRLSPLMIIALLLCAIGGSITWLKVDRLKLPLLPDKQAAVWTAEIRIGFTGRAGPAKVTLNLPRTPRGFTIIDEDFVSRGFGLTVNDDAGGPRQAIWTVRRSQGQQALYYRIKAYQDTSVRLDEPERISEPVYPEVPEYPEPLASAIDTVLDRARSESADIFTFATHLLQILSDQSDENVKLIRTARPADEWVDLVIEILAGARIPSRAVYGISLQSDFVDRDLIPWLEVNNGSRWSGFDPQTGEAGYPASFLVWAVGDGDIVDTTGVRNLEVGFSVVRSEMSQVDLSGQVEDKLDTGLMNFTLVDLPISTQGVYRVLLMLPLGALIIAFMRVVIGVPTFGTFTPILIALAFRETQLLWGVTLFLAIVSLGFLLRIALANLRLLLVPRLAAMLVIVVILMLIMSMFSAALGFEPGLSVALFPMVILTMTIERMSIVWEERGAGQTVKETLGSLLVAVAGYYVMNEPRLMHLMFHFPELLLVVLAGCMVLGAYTGYRLSEVLRFKDLARS